MPDPNCLLCEGTGWRPVEKGGVSAVERHPRAGACEAPGDCRADPARAARNEGDPVA